MFKKIGLFFLFLMPFCVSADTLDDIFKETEYAYYRNSVNAQYNSAKNSYYDPADATSQHPQYSVCSRYTANVYKNAFGITIPGNTTSLMKFATANYNDATYKKYVIFYADCVNNEAGKGTCTKMSTTDYNNLIGKLEPGDVLVYTKESTNAGHALIVYDTFKNSSGNNDAYILNSTSSQGTINSRFSGTNQLHYSYALTDSKYDVASSVSKKIGQGTIKFENFRADSRFNFTNSKYSYGITSTEKYKVAILRFVQNNKYPSYDSNYKVTSENSITYTKSNGYLRTSDKYSDISISKTVSASDNDVVELGEELTYTITIKNNSNQNYGKFYIQENVTSTYATVESASNNATISGNKVTYTVSSLKAGDTLNLTYKVKVSSDSDYLGKTIKATGKFSDTSTFASGNLYLSTGEVVNVIGKKLSSDNKTKITASYNKLKSTKKGLDLVNSVYKDALNVDLKLDSFDITKLIVEDSTKLAACNKANTSMKSCKNLIKLQTYKIGDTNYTYNQMILDNYWSALINEDGTELEGTTVHTTKNLSTWNGSTRNKTIVPENLETGDILIYYNANDYLLDNSSKAANSYEKGLYAYIYVDGSFVGINGTNKTTRNAFTYSYYTDNSDLNWYTNQSDVNAEVKTFINYQTLYNKYYYVILRPSLESGYVLGDSVKAITPESDTEDSSEDSENQPNTEDSDDSNDTSTKDENNQTNNDAAGTTANNSNNNPKNPKTGSFISIPLIIIGIVVAIVLYKVYKKKNNLFKI